MRKFYKVSKQNKKNKEEAILPIRKTELSAGYDIALPFEIHLKPKESKIYWTDIKVQTNFREFVMIVIRSSIAVKHRLSLMNGIGIIDEDYIGNESNEGNIGIPLINNSKDTVKIPAGTAIAQAIFTNYHIVDMDETLEERKGGFGSTTGG